MKQISQLRGGLCSPKHLPLETMSVCIDRNILARQQRYDLLDRICREIEPTETQQHEAQTSYEAVGEWLAASAHPWLAGVKVYAHGSTALGTTVRPIGLFEHDVDLICFSPSFPVTKAPHGLKLIVGDRLREHATYARLLQEKPRCWRLDYARQFHLDITPAISNPHCPYGGELVPDKQTQSWKASNPKGYRAKFERRALLRPRLAMTKGLATDSIRAAVEEFPAHGENKGVLRRAVQIAKRHRDVSFDSKDPTLAPISIIITTLLSRSYEHCVVHQTYESALDLLIDVVRRMPDFIDGTPMRGVGWLISNRTTAGENFAEKWNNKPALALAFFEWHGQIVGDLNALVCAEGLDAMGAVLSRALGARPVNAAMDGLRNEMSAARTAGRLAVSAGAGLTTAAIPARATPVRSNTFYGDQ